MRDRSMWLLIFIMALALLFARILRPPVASERNTMPAQTNVEQARPAR